MLEVITTTNKEREPRCEVFATEAAMVVCSYKAGHCITCAEIGMN